MSTSSLYVGIGLVTVSMFFIAYRMQSIAPAIEEPAKTVIAAHSPVKKPLVKGQAVNNRATNVAAQEEPAWLTQTRNDPDPRVRLNAIEAWSREPNASLDPLTKALADPDETVRTRAQELLDDAQSHK